MCLMPVEVIWVSKCKYNQQTYVERHIHNFFHFIYVIKGKGTIDINENEYETNEGEVFFFPPGIEHSLHSDMSNVLHNVEVKFLVHDASLLDSLKCLKYNFRPNMGNLSAKLEELILEAVYKTELYKEIISVEFTRILLELIRSSNYIAKDSLHSVQNNIDIVNSTNPELKKVVDYIHSNYAKQITLELLSNIAMVSTSYLCKIFTKKYKISPIQYVNNLRIIKSKELMMYTDMNITQISDTVGYQSMHYFSRYFKQKEMVTPIEFRNKIRNSLYIHLDEDKKIINFKLEAS